MKYRRAAAYLWLVGFGHRQLRSYRSNFGHADWGSKMVGDSQGLNRLTNTYGFLHLACAIQFNASLPKPFWQDARFKNKLFNTGTAFIMVSCMERAWYTIFQGHFTNSAMGYDRYLVVVNKAYGAYVPDSEARSGRRHETMVKLAQEVQGVEDVVKYLKSNPRKIQRKDTLTTMAHHSDLDGMVEAMQAEEKEMEAAHATAE